MRAADIEAKLRARPPHTFVLGPGAWKSMWDRRPLEPITVGLRRLGVDDRMLANACREGFLPTDESGGFALTGIMSVTTSDAIEEARESYQSSEF